MSTDPNSFDKEIKDAQNANPNAPDQGTGGGGAPSNPPADPAQPVDYAKKFAESSKEALRLLEEKKALEAENERLRALGNNPIPQGDGKPVESLYPGFEELDPDAQANLVSYTNLVQKRVKDEIYKDPSIRFAQEQYNTTKWNEAFQSVVAQFPDLAASEADFKAKYFKKEQPVPDNIKDILVDLAKVHLFDKAKDLGAADEKKKQEERVDLNRSTNGGAPQTTSRTLEDWHRMSQENPTKFASLAKEYQADIASGRI